MLARTSVLARHRPLKLAARSYTQQSALHVELVELIEVHVRVDGVDDLSRLFFDLHIGVQTTTTYT